jgi:NADH-quinone oxidoreductase subunit D
MAIRLDVPFSEMAGFHGQGPLSLRLMHDDGAIESCRVSCGWGRREIERSMESLPLSQLLPFSERMDYLAPAAYSICVAQALEEALSIEVPERSQYIRTCLLEIHRIVTHLEFFLSLSRVLNLESLRQHCQREVERYHDALEIFCGSRLGFGAVALGGVIDEASDGWIFRIEKALECTEAFLSDLGLVLSESPLFEERARGLAVITPATAQRWRLSGVNARASGLFRIGLRQNRKYLAYGKANLTFAETGPDSGDVFSRALWREIEIRESSRILRQLFSQMPKGNFRIKVGHGISSPAHSTVIRVDSPRGLLTFFFETKGGTTAQRCRFFAPSDSILQLSPGLVEGASLEDLRLILASLDFSVSEVDA